MPNGLSILIVEDNPGDVLLLQQYLTISNLQDVQTVVAQKLYDAIQTVRTVKPDLIFLDLFLPDSLGLDTFSSLNKIAGSIPVVILSGLSDSETAIKAIKAGAQDYLIKGEFDEKVVEKTVYYSIERKMISERLNASLEIHELVGAATNDIIWDWDIVHQTITPLSKAIESDFGYAQENVEKSIRWWYDKVHPDDVGGLTEKIAMVVKNRQQKGAHEFRFRKSDGKFCDVYGRANILYKESEKGQFPYRMIGIMQDVSVLKQTKEKLHWSNERYEIISNATSDVVYDWNLKLKVVTYGKGDIEKVFGYKGIEEANDNWWFEHLHPDDQERISLSISNTIDLKGAKLQNEFRFRCANGKYKYIYGRGFLFYDDSGNVYRMIGAMQDVTPIREMREKMQNQKIINQQKITEATILSQETERAMLGRELHDNINQILATCRVLIDISIKNPSQRELLLPKSCTYLETAIEEMRKLSKSLVPPSLGDIGLPEALEELLETAAIGNDVKYAYVGKKIIGYDIPDTLKLMIYRVVQEQLNNISKYAKARNVFLRLKTEKTQLIVQVEDDGVGFDMSKKAAGIGLRNIKGRTSLHGGKVSIVSQPGKGCTLTVAIPIPRKTKI